MGGKGKKRREKNYLAAHGGDARLPPPPDLSKPDALPSKLRLLLSYTTPRVSPKDSKDGEEKSNLSANPKKKRGKGQNESHTEDAKIKDGIDDGTIRSSDQKINSDAHVHDTDTEKKKKKRKRKQVKDLRFEKVMEELDGSKRKERKKAYWEAKKNKHKKGKTEENLGFPGHEKIRFGEVVLAPPKLVTVPKAPKAAYSASKERLRLQAIETYRNTKGWSSRPGLQLPSVLPI